MSSGTTGTRREKPMKMHVYQPLYVGDKYVRSIKKTFPYCRIEIGDVFTMEKRPANYHEMMAHKESKVVAVRYNFAETACIVILEKKNFGHIDLLNRYVNGK